MTEKDISGEVRVIPNSQFRDMYTRYKQWLKSTSEPLHKVYLTKEKKEYVTRARFEDMMDRVLRYPGPNVYITQTNTSPKPVWDGVYREQKYTSFDQSDKYSCGSTTGANILSTWGIKTNEAEMDKYCKTGTHGTNPQDLIDGVLRKLRESGFKNSRCDTYNTKDFGSEKLAIENVGKFIADPNHAVAVLINTGGKGWKKYYTGTYEHWVMLVEVNTNNKTLKVNDPARQATLNLSYEEFLTGVRLVPRKSWYVFVGKR